VNLDDLAGLRAIDTQNFLSDVDSVPDQLAQAWELARSLSLPGSLNAVQQVALIGMGSSALAGALAQAYAAGASRTPIVGLPTDSLPAWVGAHTLVIANSYSGDTEETLAACRAALARGARLVAITRGGQLANLAEQAGQTVWRFEHNGQSRAALGYAFALTLGVLAKLGVIPDPSAELAGAVAALRAQQRQLWAETPVTGNPAKRLAGQFMDRIPLICGAGRLAPVARYWKNQINTVAKAVAVWDELPEMGHNSVAGTLYPEGLVGKFLALFLRSSFELPRQAGRAEITREIFMTSGFNTDSIAAAGPSPLAHLLTSLHYGDYVAYYLAICYGVDPSPIPQVDYLRERLGPPSAAA
jgi:glucose/mannose-6-phosphate isomerase